MIISSLSYFDGDITALENRAEPKGAVVFYGSSTITLWGHERLKAQMKDIAAVNRGFGGSTAEQALYYYCRAVKPLEPKALVWYEGDNDIASGYSPQETFMLSERVFEWAKKDFTGIKIYLLPTKSCPSRADYIPKYEDYRRLLLDYSRGSENVYYIDYIPALYRDGETGGAPKIRRDIFLDDMLHFNDAGYATLSEIVYDFLKNTL